MYLALGDGGNANDVGPSHIVPGGNAQNLSTPLGKMLRFDPLNPALTPGSSDPISTNGLYRIPTSNPFQGPGQVPEIYAYGPVSYTHLEASRNWWPLAAQMQKVCCVRSQASGSSRARLRAN